MSGIGGLARRGQERAKRSTFIEPKSADAKAFRRKQRKGWAQWR